MHVCGRELGDMVGLGHLPNKPIFHKIGFNSEFRLLMSLDDFHVFPDPLKTGKSTDDGGTVTLRKL